MGRKKPETIEKPVESNAAPVETVVAEPIAESAPDVETATEATTVEIGVETDPVISAALFMADEAIVKTCSAVVKAVRGSNGRPSEAFGKAIVNRLTLNPELSVMFPTTKELRNMIENMWAMRGLTVDVKNSSDQMRQAYNYQMKSTLTYCTDRLPSIKAPKSKTSKGKSIPKHVEEIHEGVQDGSRPKDDYLDLIRTTLQHIDDLDQLLAIVAMCEARITAMTAESEETAPAVEAVA